MNYYRLINTYRLIAKNHIRFLINNLFLIGITCIKSSPNTIFSSSEDASVRFWNPQTGGLSKLITAHAGAVSTLCFSHSDQILYSGGIDKNINAWDTGTGKRTLLFADAHTRGVLALDSSAEKLISAGK
jgi:WD40 repeat protein